jgi:2-oxoglutarate dehydrogenase E1 component
LYKALASHPSPYEIYTKELITSGVIDQAHADELAQQLTNTLGERFDASKKKEKVNVTNFLGDLWDGYDYAQDADFDASPNTGVDKKKLLELGKKLATLPEGKKIFRKVHKLFKDRLQMLEKDQLDWGMAEMLAYATLLTEGHPVRISGQDVERGTFSHRHAVVKTEDDEEEIITLNLLEEKQAQMTIYNSLLSEYGVLGFDYGYSLASPNGLTIWEAQFGDFMNGAQIMIDQFITAGEDKWNIQSGLVMLLPHGYEGQGAEHSSARMERFLQSCGDHNIQVVNSTTPANHFHALRRQLNRNFRKPLVVFSPKMLLRYPKAVSSLNDLAKGGFQEVIDDPKNIHSSAEVVVLCSGKVYYDFIEEAEKRGVTNMAFVRVEQLYPLPKKQIDAVLAKYKKAKTIIWGQEEPENMGAWTFMAMNLRHIDLNVIARAGSASPAAGAKEIHQRRLKSLFDRLFEHAHVAVK